MCVLFRVHAAMRSHDACECKHSPPSCAPIPAQDDKKKNTVATLQKHFVIVSQHRVLGCLFPHDFSSESQYVKIHAPCSSFWFRPKGRYRSAPSAVKSLGGMLADISRQRNHPQEHGACQNVLTQQNIADAKKS